MATATEPTPPAAPVTATGMSPALSGRQALALEGHHAEHGGEAGGADRHGALGVEAFRERDDPLRLHPGEVGEPAEVVLPQPEPGDYDLVPWCDRWPRGFLDGAGEVHAADHRERADDRPLAGDRQAVLVVEARVPDP